MNIRYLLYLTLFAYTFYSCETGKNGQKEGKKQDNMVAHLEGYVVKPTLLEQSIAVSGTLKPFEETVLMPEVSGRVVKINLPEGKFVKEGTLLVKLFDGDLQAQLHKAQTQLQLAEQTQKRQKELIKVNGISQTEYDQSVLQVVSIKNDIEVIKVMIRKTEVLAPYDGVIGLKNISIGAQVMPSTSLATIRAVKQLKLDFSVPEKYSKDVRPGTRVLFTVQGDEKKYEARVMATEEGIDANTRNLKARAVVSPEKTNLVPGAFANVELQLAQDPNAVMIPTQAIIPQERHKKVIVARGGKAEFITVKTGVRQSSLIQVVNGLTPGDTVVTTGILYIKPGAGLKFSKVIK